ncbi:MAG: YkgJ family cysteine cluster protein [Deltaproteobacteria bacterium]|nr:YkgJ family cysteine cluster protein [Deltaproteobacteria bacterium]
MVEQAMPERSCARSGACCQFTVTGREPIVTHAELAAIRAELRRQGRNVPPPREDGACPLLTADGTRCSIYAARPMGCRTFFCREAGGVVTARELRDALHALNALEESRGKNKRPPRPLTRALQDRD